MSATDQMDQALQAVAELTDEDPSAHVAAFEELHRALQAQLAQAED